MILNENEKEEQLLRKISKCISKRITLFMCVAMFGIAVVGCGASEEDKKDVKDIVADDGDNGGENAESEKKGDNTEKKSESSATKTTIEEQVLIDQDGVKITATEYAKDSIWGEGIKVSVENNTDIDLTVGCDALIVNDYMITDLFACDVAAGKTGKETIYLSSSELEAAGIDGVGKVEIYFRASDSSTYDTIFEKVYTEIHTSNYDNMDTTPNDGGFELYNEGGIKIVGKTVDENSFWGTAILLYCENTTGRDVNISVEDMSVNGIMTTGYFYKDLYNNKKVISDITIMSDELEENGIETIEQVDLKFHIVDANTYETIVDTEPISFSVK